MEVRGYQEKMQTLTRDSNCITNVWNNLTEGSGGGRAVREGFQKEIISAPGGGHGGNGAESLGVTAGSVWLNPKRRRPEVARAGLKSH